MAAGYVQKVFALCYVTSFDEVRTQWSEHNRPSQAISFSRWWKNLLSWGRVSSTAQTNLLACQAPPVAAQCGSRLQASFASDWWHCLSLVLLCNIEALLPEALLMTSSKESVYENITIKLPTAGAHAGQRQPASGEPRDPI